MWNRHPVVRQEKLHREALNNRKEGILRSAIQDGRQYLGTRQDVKAATGELPVTGEELSDE